MSNFLIKAKLTFTSPTVDEALALREKLEDIKCGVLKTFQYKGKEIKEKGEVVDEYQVVTADLEFTSEKNPDNLVTVNFEGEQLYGEF